MDLLCLRTGEGEEFIHQDGWMDAWMHGWSVETRVSREREVRGPAVVQVR